MTTVVKARQINQIFSKDEKYFYSVPPYQREYVWTTENWNKFYEDILESNETCFLGSIIYINCEPDGTKNSNFEIVDGQQRLLTICLLLAAIYERYFELDLKTDAENKLFSDIKKQLTIDSEGKELLRFIPQEQNDNKRDFLAVMSAKKSGILKNDNDEPAYWGNRRIAKCYKYFLKRLKNDMETKVGSEKIEFLKEAYSKAVQSQIVTIEVDNQRNAYTLFECLNDRGMPLDIVDLLKNIYISTSKNKKETQEKAKQWERFLSHLNKDPKVQERFLRHYYNAFSDRLPMKKKPAMAVKSNLLDIYEPMLKECPEDMMKGIIEATAVYSKFVCPQEDDKDYYEALSSLQRIQGSPAYLLLLYLFKMQKQLKLRNDTLREIINLLVTFFVRRNLTDVPATRELTKIFMEIINNIREKKLYGKQILTEVTTSLKAKAANNELFEKNLRGDIYADNEKVTRFLLCALVEDYKTNEKWQSENMWKKRSNRANAKPYWTIEHIFPEGRNIPPAWVNMIADGKKALAEQRQKEYVHKLGNLTLSAYNSDLGNKCFEDKKEAKNKDGNYIGYKNGLPINTNIVDKKQWTIKEIKKRTDEMVKRLLEKYKF